VFDEAAIIRIRDVLGSAVAETLSESDPSHIVTDAMVDLRVEEIGPLDRIRSDLFVTLVARDEPCRQLNKSTIPEQLAAALREIVGSADVVVELVLTQHASSFDYSLLEGA
jgi:hypothetical protein